MAPSLFSQAVENETPHGCGPPADPLPENPMFSLIQKIAKSRPSCLSTSILLLVGLGLGLSEEIAAQATVPGGQLLEVEPRFERLFGTDSLRLAAGVGGPNDMRSPALSPDGRWIVFGANEQRDRANLWLSPVDGGEMVRLTQGEYIDDRAQWFASGEAIAFLSSRPAGSAQDETPGYGLYVMRMPISPENGRPLGPPRQVSLEKGVALAISPDDRWIAYAARSSEVTTDSRTSLRVLPATGGTVRTVITIPGPIMAIRWGVEGRFLYLLTWPARGVQESVLVRVPVEGGTPERIANWNTTVRLSPHARYFHREIPSEGEEEGRRYEMSTVDGQHRVTFGLPGPLKPMGFGGRPGQLLAARVDVANPLRVLPVAGGPVRRLNEAWGYDLPMGWSPDGQEVFFKTQLNGQPIYMFAPLDGGTMRQVPLPESHTGEWPILSGDGEHVLFLTDGQEESERGVWIYDIGEDRSRKLDEGIQPQGYSFMHRWGIMGRGGTFMRDEAVFLYGITRNGRHELMAADPEGAPSLLWSFPDEGPPPFVAVHGNRVAFAQNEGPEASLYLAWAGEDRARLLLTRTGRMSAPGMGSPKWSPDGRRLAVPYTSPEPARSGVLVVEVSEAGEVVGEPLTLEGAWLEQWMPDGEHFLGNFSGAGTGWTSEVWLHSLDPDVPPVPVTPDHQESIWYFILSPDGRHIAVESETPRGSSVWRVDLNLGDAFRQALRGGGPEGF